MTGESPERSWTLPDSLRELAEEGNEFLVMEVLSVFRSDSTERLEILSRALAAGDRLQIRNQAHALKGSSSQIGADDMAAVCQEMELLAPTAAAGALATLADRAKVHFVAVLDAITRQYGQ